ncbi:MAG: TonB C-terminal domain-containing protein [Oligoflexia bacterium]|nr:TonB C-terminal domain-containing protein [Oligoflexia bacterium]
MKFFKAEKKNILFITFCASVIFHLIIISIVGNFDLKKFLRINKKITVFDNTQSKKNYIKISMYDRSKLFPLKAPIKELATSKTEKEKQQKPDPYLKKQIVNNENNGIEKRPDNSRFLGEKNQSYEKQTIANSIGTFNKAGLGAKDGFLNNKRDVSKETSVKNDERKKVEKQLQIADSTSTDVASSAVKDKLIAKDKVSMLNKIVKKDLGTFALSDLNVSKNETYNNNLVKHIIKTNNKKITKKKVSKVSEEKIEDQPNNKNLQATESNNDLINDEENLKKLGLTTGDTKSRGLSKNNDFIEDVPLGDLTNLNTVEFKHFGFYSRIRERLEQYWGATLKSKAEQIYKTGKKLSPGHNYITSLKITIDLKGNIIKIQILGSSGHEYLDNAAIDSFNKAGPFPNPPRDLLRDGMATLEWGFVVRS